MEVLQFILHIDVYLVALVQAVGFWSYAILFLIVFFERGCILTPFLPGDSLLFAAGVIAATGALNIGLLILVLAVACFLGTLINCWLGGKLGHYAYRADSRWLNRKHLDKARAFFERFGTSALVLSCFIPIVRTFTPFVAGMAMMNKTKCLLATILASVVWVVGLLCLSYSFGNIPFIKSHFSMFVLALIIVPSLIPVLAYLRRR
jgi:membrane-associated protein